jgi:hypothetical protein
MGGGGREREREGGGGGEWEKDRERWRGGGSRTSCGLKLAARDTTPVSMAVRTCSGHALRGANMRVCVYGYFDHARVRVRMLRLCLDYIEGGRGRPFKGALGGGDHSRVHVCAYMCVCVHAYVCRVVSMADPGVNGRKGLQQTTGVTPAV